MRDLSKVKQKSLQKTYELHHSAQVPCAFTLQLQQQSCSLEKGSLVLGEALPQTQDDCDCQVKSLKKMMVAQCATISFILHAKKKKSPLCFNCLRISSKHQANSPQKRAVSLESHTLISLHF